MHCSPKNVVLEDHVVSQMRCRLGSGLMGEQGVESIHAHLMKLESTHQAIPYGADQIEILNGVDQIEILNGAHA